MFTALKLPQNCFIMNFGSPTKSHIPCLKDNPHNLTECKSKGTSKIPIV